MQEFATEICGLRVLQEEETANAKAVGWVHATPAHGRAVRPVLLWQSERGGVHYSTRSKRQRGAGS